MLSKRIVISMIVIGCMVQYITCPNPENRSQKTPSSKSSTKPTLQPVQPRAVQPNKETKAKIAVRAPTNLARKPTIAAKKPEAVNKNLSTGDFIEDEEIEEEKPVSSFRKIFSKFNKIRKLFFPFRFASKAIGKTKRFLQPTAGLTKTRPTDDNDTITLD